PGARPPRTGLGRPAGEERDDPEDAPRAAKREAEGGSEAGAARRARAREVRVLLHVRYPGRLAAHPYAPWQALPRRERDASREGHELVGVHTGRTPGLDADKSVRVAGGRLPGPAQTPPEPPRAPLRSPPGRARAPRPGPASPRGCGPRGAPSWARWPCPQ